MNRTSESTLEFTNGLLSLTIDNIVQARPGNPETDTGRYFLEATNEAGVDSSYINLVVFGKCIHLKCIHITYLYRSSDTIII